MISDNLLPIAMFVFVIMMIGLVLTFIEFRYGEPKRQQDKADRDAGAVGKDKAS
ncbi:hypothetical protein N8460_07165 [Oceanospirillaceae bacterium]|jgi:hypothetical protein|nr:hypothetical protein [Oceanospirillaceae bacterium]MDO7653851.1 hypothetical protein [Porticoccus sp.]MBT4997111.1 hypothetical protein [Oceanospirillaceae bacterium]MBT5628958.1 hypothetical protein [Oceanospirillaceae bacterium]MBT6100211.1 hypothetical protein [Oceanospirillaceae bacterium]|tara:strand:+ start:80 stop:241 length:162 start_codon:yes stop_codon:yes gene_type:complete